MNYTDSHAIIEGDHRYYLRRSWGIYPDNSRLTWCMLNPSTADATIDDPTLRRIAAFSHREGWAGLFVVNLFALRASNPAALHTHPDPVGPRNRNIIRSVVIASTALVVAWGAAVDKHPQAAAERKHLLDCARQYHVPTYCLGLTKANHPRHPLYVRGDQPLLPVEPE